MLTYGNVPARFFAKQFGCIGGIGWNPTRCQCVHKQTHLNQIIAVEHVLHVLNILRTRSRWFTYVNSKYAKLD